MKLPAAKAQHIYKNTAISYAGYRFPPELNSYAVWLYFCGPLSLCIVEEMLAARGIEMTYETVRRWARKFGQQAASRIRARLSTVDDKWYLDAVAIAVNGKKHWLWLAVALTLSEIEKSGVGASAVLTQGLTNR